MSVFDGLQHGSCVAQISAFVQQHSNDLGKVMDIVISHQALPRKMELIGQLLNSLVLPAPEHYRSLLRRLAALGASQAGISRSNVPCTGPCQAVARRSTFFVQHLGYAMQSMLIASQG